MQLSVEHTKECLGLDDKGYSLLRDALLREMNVLGILGQRLNTSYNKTLLRQVFDTLRDEFKSLSQGLPTESYENCLKDMAQRCNYNQRRRLSPSSSAPVSMIMAEKEKDIYEGLPAVDKPIMTTMNTARTLDSVMIQVHRQRKEQLLCRPKEFLIRNKTITGQITVDDMSFNMFLQRLSTGLKYDSKQEMLMYDCSGEDRTQISSQDDWRAAIEEMFSLSFRRFHFSIEAKCSK